MLNMSGMHCIPRWTLMVESNANTRMLCFLLLIFGFMIQVDATFRTNVQKMPLVSVTGITNNNATFLISLCFIRTENRSCFYMYKVFDME